MASPIEMRNEKLGKKVVEALKKRQFEAYYVENSCEAVKKALEIIPAEDSISWGGSQTIDNLGLKDKLFERGNRLIDRDTAKSAEERDKIMLESLSCGTFLMSSNAITENGELFNIDGRANRVAALCFGPKSVVIIAGMNKVVPDLEAAYSRVRHYTSPINAQRFCNSTPCSKTGACADCINPETICCQMLATRYCKIPNRIKVILVGETLGM